MRRRLGIGMKTAPSHAECPSPSSPDSFIYTPLRDTDEIRLLNLAPRLAAKDVQDSIEHVVLSASPLYTAISWMWGRPGDLIQFKISGLTLTVQRNLERIIEHLREDSQRRRVWIDAVCINQQSLMERNHQVQMMGMIYAQANYVVACLNTVRAKDSKYLRREAERLHKQLQKRNITKTCSYPYLFGNEYFTRRWIIQEIAQAQTVTLCCEGYLLPMNALRNAISDSSLQTQPNHADAHWDDSAFSDAGKVAHARAVQLCSGEPSSQPSTTSMEDLLYLHETAKCQDFHDQIYALISLTTKSHTHLSVQYDISRSQLMLAVLHFCHDQQGLSEYRMLSFTSFLRHHLKVMKDDLCSAVTNSNTNVKFRIQGTIRGTVTTLPITHNIEEVALRIRPTLPALLAHDSILLQRNRSTEQLEFYPSLNQDTQSPGTVGISGTDFCLFTFTGNMAITQESAQPADRSTSPPRYNAMYGPLFVGLANTKVVVGDEIWQFDRTPVVVIARKTSQDYQLMGRAFLISDLRANKQIDPSRLEDGIVWVKDGREHLQATPVVSVNLRGLHEMVMWVNLDF